MGNENNIYNMSFTAGALLQQPSLLFAELYSTLGDWQAARAKVLEGNLLQARTQNTAHRICREVIARLKPLNADQLAILSEGLAKDQAQVLWTAICKRYRFIHDFAVEKSVMDDPTLSLSIFPAETGSTSP